MLCTIIVSDDTSILEVARYADNPLINIITESEPIPLNSYTIIYGYELAKKLVGSLDFDVTLDSEYYEIKPHLYFCYSNSEGDSDADPIFEFINDVVIASTLRTSHSINSYNNLDLFTDFEVSKLSAYLEPGYLLCYMGSSFIYIVMKTSTIRISISDLKLFGITYKYILRDLQRLLRNNPKYTFCFITGDWEDDWVSIEDVSRLCISHTYSENTLLQLLRDDMSNREVILNVVYSLIVDKLDNIPYVHQYNSDMKMLYDYEKLLSSFEFTIDLEHLRSIDLDQYMKLKTDLGRLPGCKVFTAKYHSRDVTTHRFFVKNSAVNPITMQKSMLKSLCGNVWEFDIKSCEPMLMVLMHDGELSSDTRKLVLDMHDKASEILKISRDEAKLINNLCMYDVIANQFVKKLQTFPSKDVSTYLNYMAPIITAKNELSCKLVDEYNRDGYVKIPNTKFIVFPKCESTVLNTVIQTKGSLILLEIIQDLLNLNSFDFSILFHRFDSLFLNLHNETPSLIDTIINIFKNKGLVVKHTKIT